MSNTFDTRPISQAGGVEVLGIDITQPLAPLLKDALVDLFNEHGVLLFRGQSMSKAALVAASRIFGEPEPHTLGINQDLEMPEVAVVSTLGRNGNVMPENDEDLVGRIEWHTDQAYTPAPNRATMMWAVELPPEGGLTGFIDCAKIYDALPSETKRRIEGLTVIQSWRKAQDSIAKNPNYRTDEGMKMMAEDRYPDLGYELVRVHPITGRKVLHAPPMWSSGIVGLPRDQGRELLDDLFAHSLQDKFIHWQKYCPGDVIIWDNWRFMHAASGTKGKYKRLMYRTVLKGGVVFGHTLAHASAAKKGGVDKTYV